MNYGDALVAMKQGERVFRKGWNAEGMYVALHTPDELSPMIEPYTYIDTTQSSSKIKTKVPWVPSQTDQLAEDWYIQLEEKV